MLTYPALGQAVQDYLISIQAFDSARPVGAFRGGAVIQLAPDHYIAALIPTVDPDEALSNCVAYLQGLELWDWDITGDVLVGEGPNTMTVLHIQPPLAAA